jgi:hypothetical protein
MIANTLDSVHHMITMNRVSIPIPEEFKLLAKRERRSIAAETLVAIEEFMARRKSQIKRQSRSG